MHTHQQYVNIKDFLRAVKQENTKINMNLFTNELIVICYLIIVCDVTIFLYSYTCLDVRQER